MPKVFCNPNISLHVKKLLYMAIPMNLLLWGCETWAMKDSDWRFLQVFHTTSIRRIFNFNMADVQNQRITNSSLYTSFNIDPIENIVASRQLRWIGKISLMSESRLPRMFINAWHENPRPVGRPLTTIRHTYLHSLRLIGEISDDDDVGLLDDWMTTIRNDPTDWDRRRFGLTPLIVGYTPPET